MQSASLMMESEMKENWLELQERIGYRFNDTGLLKTALTHSSYANENAMPKADCNERLEFLGDAVLELVTSDFLFNKFRKTPEGEMTRMRASLVCENALAFDAKQLRLNEYLFLGKGEENTGGRERASITSDACEALIGAVYIDGGLEKAREFILKHILNNFESKRILQDSKSMLQEISQRDFDMPPKYEIVKESGPAHDKVFTARVSINGEVFGTGMGKTKKNAEQQASYNALVKLNAVGKDVSEKYRNEGV